MVSTGQIGGEDRLCEVLIPWSLSVPSQRVPLNNRVSELKSVLEDIVRSALVETVWCSAEHLDHFTLADVRGHRTVPCTGDTL